MRLRLLALFLVLMCISVALGDDPAKVLTPSEASKKLNEQVTVELQIKSATLRKGNCFLNSEEDYRNANNFTIFMDRNAVKKFKKAKIADPAAHFKGKTVRVTGKVTLYRKKPQIVVQGPEQIQIADKKAPAAGKK